MAKHHTIGPYSEYVSAHDKAQQLRMREAKSVMIRKVGREWFIDYVAYE